MLTPLVVIAMLLRLCAIIPIVAFSFGHLGCSCPSSNCGVPGVPGMPCPQETILVEESAADLSESFSGPYELIPLPSPHETFQLLDAPTCQCYAATNAPIANMVELERHWAKVTIECDTKNVGENLRLDRDLLALHIADHRNSAAASALEAFYQLAGIESQKIYLRLGLEEAQETLRRVDKLRDNGLSVPQGVDRAAISARIGDLEDQQLQLDLTRIQLNGQLQKLIGCPLNEYAFYWPQMDWQPNLDPVDVEGAVAHGLDTRSDVRGLALVICNLEKTTLTVARGVLKFADSTLGTVEPREGLIHALRCIHCNGHEVPVRCHQLAIFYEHTEQGAIAEIKNAAYKRVVQQKRVVDSQEKVQDLQEKLRELNETRDVEDVSVFQISNVQGQVYQAHSNLIQQLVALKLAEVELRRTQGMLSVECGFSPCLCLEGCCNGACVRDLACCPTGKKCKKSKRKCETCRK